MKQLKPAVNVADESYTRQVITIRQEAYEKLRQIAFADNARRLKIGDVIEKYVQIVESMEATRGVADREFAAMRDAIRPAPKAKLVAMLKGMSAEEIAELLKEANE